MFQESYTVVLFLYKSHCFRNLVLSVKYQSLFLGVLYRYLYKSVSVILYPCIVIMSTPLGGWGVAAVSGPFKEKNLSYLYQIWCGCLLG